MKLILIAGDDDLALEFTANAKVRAVAELIIHDLPTEGIGSRAARAEIGSALIAGVNAGLARPPAAVTRMTVYGHPKPRETG